MLNEQRFTNDEFSWKGPVSSSVYPELNKGIVLVEAHEPVHPWVWLEENRDTFDKVLLKAGGILLRGFDIHSVSEFNKFSQTLSNNLLNYTYRSTPRSNIGGKIFTTTEYPSDQTIPLHNENSYSDSWPNKITFFCVIPSSSGGETPIGDSRSIYENIDKDVIELFEEKKVLYVRNYSPGVDLSWQEVFQTSDKGVVEQYCRDHSIDFIWKKKGPELTTKQICQATLKHPVSGEMVWFNQAHLFHISNLSDNLAASLISEVGKENMPRNAFYGDGSEIDAATLSHIREVYANEKMAFKWLRGDIMVLDNLLMTHGRHPYTGERKIVVSMS